MSFAKQLGIMTIVLLLALIFATTFTQAASSKQWRIVVADPDGKVTFIHYASQEEADEVIGFLAGPDCSDPDTDVRECEGIVWEDRYGRYQQHPALGPVGDDHPIWDATDPYTSGGMPQHIRDEKISEDMRRQMHRKEREMFPGPQPKEFYDNDKYYEFPEVRV